MSKQNLPENPIHARKYHGIRLEINNRIKVLAVNRKHRYIEVNGTFANKLKTWQQYFLLEFAKSLLGNDNYPKADKRAFNFTAKHFKNEATQLQIVQFFETLNFGNSAFKKQRIQWMITEDKREAEIKQIIAIWDWKIWKTIKKLFSKK